MAEKVEAELKRVEAMAEQAKKEKKRKRKKN
jgi:hypothetical protein